MRLPPLQPVTNSDIYVSGDVTIHESAVVAPGTILQAAPNSRIVIGAGACIGMGAILNACQGVIEVAVGAILGAGVLIIGEARIGNNACIGAATTIFNTSIKALTVVPAGSLIGDPSRQVAAPADSDTVIQAEPSQTDSSTPTTERVTDRDSLEVEVANNSIETESSSNQEKSSVIGQVYINQLLFTLFPEGRSFNR